MRCIELRFQTASAFLRAFLAPEEDSTGCGDLLVRPFFPVLVGQRVAVDLQIESVMERFCFNAVVAEVPALIQVDGRVRKGARITVNADEGATIEALLNAVEQDLASFRERKQKRSGVSMEVESERFGDDALEVGDVSSGGLFVLGPDAPRVGEMVKMRLVAPDFALDRHVVGEVAWHGFKGDEAGFGVRFVFKTHGERREWRGIFARLKRSPMPSRAAFGLA